MKLQLTDQALRVRVNESELARLLDGETLTLRTGSPTDVLLRLDAMLGDDLALKTTPHWVVSLPAAAVRDYIRTLPRRDALPFLLPGMEPFTILFEVDVRDSVRVRVAPQRT